MNEATFDLAAIDGATLVIGAELEHREYMGNHDLVTVYARQIGVYCSYGQDRYGEDYRSHGWYKISEINGAGALIGQPCSEHKGCTYERYDEVRVLNVYRDRRCAGGCGKIESKHHVEMRYSLGLPVSEYCTPCWDKSGYRKEGAEGFDPAYAGESYDGDY